MTLKSCGKSVADFKRCAFNMNQMLSSYFHKPTEFCALQGEMGTLISGSFALHFLSHYEWAENDLDLYTWGTYNTMVSEFLLSEDKTFVYDMPNKDAGGDAGDDNEDDLHDLGQEMDFDTTEDNMVTNYGQTGLVYLLHYCSWVVSFVKHSNTLQVQ